MAKYSRTKRRMRFILSLFLVSGLLCSVFSQFSFAQLESELLVNSDPNYPALAFVENDPNMAQNINLPTGKDLDNSKKLTVSPSQLCQQGRYQEALDAYKKIMQSESVDSQQVVAKAALTALFDIGHGHEPNEMLTLSELAEAYSESPDLGSALIQASSIYYTKATKSSHGSRDRLEKLSQAVQGYELAMEHAVTPEMSAQACYQLAECCRLMGNDTMALEHYRLVLSNWPDFKYAWNAQFMIGHCSEKLARQGLLDAASSEAACIQAYTAICENFPECPASKAASQWLKKHGIDN